VGKVLNQLRKNGAACVHAPLFRRYQADNFDFQIVPEASDCIMQAYHCCPAILQMACGKVLCSNEKAAFKGVSDLN
jgi:hypothetical protein